MPRAIDAIGNGWKRHRDLAGKFAFELVIVFIGVTAAFALENKRESLAEAKYQAAMIAALRPTLDDVIEYGDDFDAEVAPKLAAFDAAIAAGGKPALPIFRESYSERPPTRAWDGLVASGAARALDPKLFFDLAMFYTSQESFGERYLRYNDFTEQRVYAAGDDPAVFYDPRSGKLKPEFAAHVDRLRDLQAMLKTVVAQARELRKGLDARAGALVASAPSGRGAP